MSLFDVHLTDRKAHLATGVVITILVVAMVAQIYLGFASVRWAWLLLVVPLGFLVATVLGVTNRIPRGLLPLIHTLFPIVRLQQEERQRIAANGQLVRAVEETLGHYKLGELDDDSRQDLSEHLYGFDLQGVCCKAIANLLKNREPKDEHPNELQRRHLSKDLLLLLHRSYHDGNELRIWSEKKTELVPGLAVLLAESGRLPQKEAVFPILRDNYLERALGSLPTFNLDLVRAQLKCLHEMWRDSLLLADFLGDNRLAATLPLPGGWLSRLEESTGLPVKSPDEDLEALLRWITEQTVRHSFAVLSEAEVHRYSSIALVIFASEKLRVRRGLQRTTCGAVAADPEALSIVMAFLELREQLEHGDYSWEGEKFVTLRRLLEAWAEKVEEIKTRLGTGFDVEIETLRRDLEQGTWNNRLPRVIRTALKKMSSDSAEILDTVKRLEKKTKSYDSAKRVFRGLSLDTIERYLQARNVNAYLMTFDAGEGKLARLIDCLKDTEALEELGVEPMVNGRLKYVFKQYTPSTRIGVVPRGWSFERFHQAFQNDFTTVVENRADLAERVGAFELAEVELILQRFGLQDHYAFDSQFRSKRAVEQIMELFADVLEPEELVAVIHYQEEGKVPILKAFMEGPISELAGELFRLEEVSDPQLRKELQKQKRVLDDNHALVTRELLQKLERMSVAELGRTLLPPADADERQIEDAGRLGERAKATLAGLIRGLNPELFGPERSRAIAASYLNSLRVIAETAV